MSPPPGGAGGPTGKPRPCPSGLERHVTAANNDTPQDSDCVERAQEPARCGQRGVGATEDGGQRKCLHRGRSLARELLCEPREDGRESAAWRGERGPDPPPAALRPRRQDPLVLEEGHMAELAPNCLACEPHGASGERRPHRPPNSNGDRGRGSWNPFHPAGLHHGRLARGQGRWGPSATNTSRLDGQWRTDTQGEGAGASWTVPD